MSVFADRGRDAGDVDMMHALQRGVEVVFRWLGKRNGAMLSIVQNRRTALICADFDEINAQSALLSPIDVIGIHADAAEGVRKALRNHVPGQSSQEPRLLAKHCQRNANVSFAATPSDVDLPWHCLWPAQSLRRSDASHDLAKSKEHLSASQKITCWSDRLLRRRQIASLARWQSAMRVRLKLHKLGRRDG